jgi:catechol 2,3-dioxygenase-like lactoylglutathione lyase family enzyme
MINGFHRVGIWVLDQDEALAFYTEKLGFALGTDAMMDNGYRWLTVIPPKDPVPELVLSLAGPPSVDEETATHMRALLAKGSLSGGVLSTDDCRATYEQLQARGVEFLQEPAERPYGIEAVFRDNSGNWFSLVQPKAP